VKPERWLATVLFTDIVGSTEKAAELGDRRWRELLETHHALARREIARHKGRELNMTGDGFLATFDAPERALRCACAIRAAVRKIRIEIRGGLHTGEVELVGNNVGGIAVHIAARVMAAASPGEIVVSSTLRDLAAGSGFGFEDRGTHALKGVPGEWHLYSVASEPVSLPVAGFWERAREARLPRVLLGYLAAAAGLLWLTAFLRDRFQLPDWMLPGAIVLLLIGLVVLVATAWVQSHPLTPGRAEREEVPGSWELDLKEMRRSVAGGRLPHLTWSRSILGGVVAFSLLFGLAGIYVIVKDRGRTLGPPEAVAGDAVPAIAVLPFTVNDPALDKWREGMVDLLATNLDGVTGLRAIDSRTVLARWRETVKGAETPDLKTAIDVARRAGARYAMLGSAVTSGAGMRLAADVYEVTTGASLGEGQVEGPADSIFGLVDRLSIEALRATLGGSRQDRPSVSLASVTTTSLSALKAYLEGEALFRRSDFKGATAAYEQAVAADSIFALALWRLATCVGWQESIVSDLMVQYAERAGHHADRLPPREAALVRGFLALERGTLDGIEPLREFVRRYPDDVEGWYLLGDTYQHLGPQALIDPAEADRAFARAVQLDPSFTPAYIHLVDNAFADADSARAARWVATYARLAAGSSFDIAGRLEFDLAFGDASTRPRGRAAMDTLQTRLLTMVGLGLFHPRFLEVQEEAFKALRQRSDAPPTAAIFLFFNNVLRGKLRAALERLDDPLLPPGFSFAALYNLFAMGLPVPAKQLDEGLLLDAAKSLGPQRGDRFAIFYAGAYAADRASWADHDQAVAWLQAEAQNALAAGDSAEARFVEGEALALEGYRQWKEGRREEAVRTLETAERQATGHGPRSGVNDMLRIWLGRLMLEMGRTRDAERYFASLHPAPPASYQLGKIYEELGDFAKARAAYELFALGWKDADPELQPRVAEARAAIQRLSSAIKE
jgi:tetratricopeptide (TPR) repeat protein/TolB-like protein